MTRRELMTMAAAVLASPALDVLSGPASLPELPLTVPSSIGRPIWRNGQCLMNLTVDTGQFKADLERLKSAHECGLISTADLQARLDNGTLVKMVQRG